VRQVLRLPAYRRLLAAYALNELAFSIGSLALSVLVYRKTGSAIAAAGYFLSSQFLPALISPALVARLDQRSSRIVLPVLYAAEAVAFVVLAWLASRFALGAVLLVALVDGVLALAARALARAATVTVTSPHGLLREGNAVANGAFSVCFMAGPAIGGAIVALGGAGTALLTDAVLFAAMSLTLVGAGSLPPPAQTRDPTGGRLRASLAYAISVPPIRALLGLQAAAVMFFAISIPVEVVFATHTLHAGAGGLGALTAVWGTGAVAGSVFYARFRAVPPRVLISVGAGALAAGFVVMAAAPGLQVALIGALVAGLGNGIEAVSARTALQEQVEEAWMAMMMSLNESILQAVPGAGIVVGGAITAITSPRVALAVAGSGALLITALAWAVLTPRQAVHSVA
jgi:predicted MFS family arabinose efflux permease